MKASSKSVGEKINVDSFTEHFKGCHPNDDIRTIQMVVSLKIFKYESQRQYWCWCPCIASIIVNDDKQDTTISVYLFIPNQLYMFRAMSSPIIRST